MTAAAGPPPLARARGRVDVAAVGLFLAVTFGAAWLITIPLWSSGQVSARRAHRSCWRP